MEASTRSRASIATSHRRSDVAIDARDRDIAPPERLGFTHRFNDDPGKEALVAIRLDERDGKTTMVMTALYRSVEDRNAVLEIGVDRGTAESLERLAGHLETMA